MSDAPTPGSRTSLRDIAQALKISHVAVSLALRDSPRVSEARRLEVKAMAEKLGYRPDPMLASLVAYRQAKRTTPISACLAWINQWETPADLRAHREFDSYWLGASAAAERLGYRLEEFCWPKGKPAARLQNILTTRGVRGVLLPPHRGELDLPGFDWSGFSIVRFGASITTVRAHSVTSDQSHCARLAYEKAHAYGYRRIGYVSVDASEKATRGHFREGYLNAQEEHAPKARRLDTLVLGDDPRRHLAALKAWLRSEKPDALISSAPNLSGLLQELGLRVPEDIGVAATSVLDGNFDAGSDQNSHEIGRVAASTLASLILQNERGFPQYERRILVDGRWVDGASLPPRSVASH